MSDAVCALGVDPGKVTAFLLACWQPGARKASQVRVFYADMGSAVFLAELLLCEDDAIDSAQVEAYDRRLRSGRTAGSSPAAMQALVTELEVTLGRHGVRTQVRSAGQVKPWATESRLRAAGLWEAIPGKMRDDGGSAAQHCLYTACKDLGMRDPLSRRGNGHAPPGG